MQSAKSALAGRTVLAVGILVAVVVSAGSGVAFAQKPLGVDISYYQGSSGMAQSVWDDLYASGRTFAAIRIYHYTAPGEGDNHADPDLSCGPNMIAAKNAHILAGVYDFVRPEKLSPQADANAFINYATHYFQDADGNYLNFLSPGYLRPMLDLESGSNTTCVGAANLTDWCLQWINTVQAATGVTPFIYVNFNYASMLDSRIAPYPCWIAHYLCSTNPQTGDPTEAGRYSLSPWTNWVAWQYCSSLKFDNITMDMDVFNGTAAQLQSYVIGVAITSVQATAVTDSAATITWTTSIAADSQVQYGATTSYGSTTPLDSTQVTAHSVNLSGLSPKTLYHYRVASTVNGMTTYSGDYTFTTGGAPVISNVQAGSILPHRATITWTTDTQADSQVNYGPTAGYGSQSPLDTNEVTSHSVVLTGLNASTTYHYQVLSANSYPPAAQSSDFTFTTPADPPVITNVQAGSIGDTAATISWTTNVGATSQVEYGTSTSYGQSTVVDNNLVTAHAVNLTGLFTGTLYHYRVISAAGGSAATSGDYTFNTTGTPAGPVITSVAAGNWAYDTSSTLKVDITWTTNLVADSQVEYGPTAAYGSSSTLDSTQVTSHTVTLSGITFNSTYHYRVRSSGGGGVRYSNDYTFSTVVIDNTDTACTKNGSWTSASVAGVPRIGSDYLYKAGATGGTSWVKWTPSIPTAGLYDVWVFYQKGTNRNSTAPFSVVYSGGTFTSTQNQYSSQANQGGWYKLNVMPLLFAAGTSGYAQVSNNTSNTALISADAAMFVTAPDTETPTLPASVTATVTGPTSIQLSWTASTDNVGVGGYKVYRGGNYLASSLTNSFTNTGLTANTSYSYQVSAYDAASNESALSSPAVSRVTLSPPPGATSVTPDNGAACAGANVVWTAVGGFGAGHVQYYRYAWDQIATHTFTGGETQWSAGTLTTAVTAPGNWYLHVQGFNSANVASGTYDYAVANPCRTITQWRTVRTHGGTSALGITLDPSATTPILEPRSGGIQRIEVQFDGPVTLGSASAVQITGQTTAAGVPGDAVSYAPASVSVVSGNTLAIEFGAGALPDATCYTITLASEVIQETATGNASCRVRALAGDVTASGVVNLGDALFVRTQIDQPVSASTAAFDVDLDGAISMSDVLAVKALVTSPAAQVVCP